jgi:TolB-like protein
MIGQTIAHYRILSALGAGGMGEVYLAEDLKLGRRVALKLPKQAGAHHEQLLREARMAARLDHPNICQVYEAGEHEGQPYIAMQYVEGETLADRLRRGRLTENEAVDIARQAATGLAEAHRLGVLHRDIKPANIMLGVRGHVKVMDFGLAVRETGRASDESSTKTLDTATGAITGTLRYMSPEQLRGEPLDARSDIFSFGAVMYEMFAGRRAFAAEQQPELMAVILGGDPTLTDVPPRYRALIKRCLAKNRVDRPEGMAGVLEELTGAPKKSPRRLVAGIAVATLAAVGVGIVLLQRATSANIHSLAILGFENRSGDSNQDYFADGLTNALAAGLARLNGLRVIPPAATVMYKGVTKSLEEIGKELDADALFDGSVSRTGNRIQIKTRLVDGRRGRDLWSRTYDVGVADLPGSQNQIERDIAAQVHASPPDRARLIDTRKLDPRAYDLSLRASFHAARYTPESIDLAIDLYEQAITIAPDFAPLQANLASAYADKSFNFTPNDPQIEAKAFAAIEKAFMLDPDSAEAHLARGKLLWRPSHGFPHRAALNEYRLAATARPNLEPAWTGMAGILMHVGHLDEALAELRKAGTLDREAGARRIPEVHLFQGKAQLFLDESIRVVLPMNLPMKGFDEAWALIDVNRLDEADRVIRSAFDQTKPNPLALRHSVAALLAARRGNRTLAESEIRAALAEPKGFGHFHHVTFMAACAYAVLGEVDRAQELMERTAREGFPSFTLFEVEPSLERWRATPKAREFLAGLRKEWEATP